MERKEDRRIQGDLTWVGNRNCLFFSTFNSKKFLVKVCMWWRMPVTPATWEVETGGSLELRGSGLQCAVPGQRLCLPPPNS
uniref:Uncharacterized protein n=1 Tax=Terrapene triunguis TaxID=2587831 RepID=A0A674I889_9SAUR